MIASRTGQLTTSVLHLLHRAGQTADELFAKETKGADLTPRQYVVLVALAENIDASQTDIVNVTGIDRSTLADIVKRLLDRGLIARRRSRIDARAYVVRLNAAGTAALLAAIPALDRVDAALLGSLPAAQRSVLVDALASIARGQVRG